MLQILTAALFCFVSADADVGNLQETPLIEIVGVCASRRKPAFRNAILYFLW